VAPKLGRPQGWDDLSRTQGSDIPCRPQGWYRKSQPAPPLCTVLSLFTSHSSNPINCHSLQVYPCAMSTDHIRTITTHLGLNRAPYQRARGVDATELYALSSPSMSHGHSSDLSIHIPAVSFTKDDSGKSGRWSWFRRCQSRLSGWRFGVLNFAIWTLVVGSFNLAITIWGSIASKENQGLLDAGDCDRIKRVNTGIHLLINVFSTVLLGGSNYCMQCLSAPTRKEIDRAHAAGTWLDIGIPSFRNLRYIRRRRVALWFLLGLSSLPLHLL
jgi:hypothetical protein